MELKQDLFLHALEPLVATFDTHIAALDAERDIFGIAQPLAWFEAARYHRDVMGRGRAQPADIRLCGLRMGDDSEGM